MGQNWQIDPITGDYVMDGGAPVQTDSLQVPAYYRLKITRNQWLYNPGPTYGSTFQLIRKRPPGGDNTAIENTALAALQPILDDGRAVSITVDSRDESRSNVALEVFIEKQRGVFDQLSIPALLVTGGS